MSRETVEEIAEEADRVLRKQLAGPCPRCSATPLLVYTCVPLYSLERYELVRETGTAIDAEFEYPDSKSVDRLIYCPKCGALHEIGGETNYPQSGKVGLPQPVEGADVIPLFPWRRKHP